MQIKTKIVSCHTADFKTVKQEVNGTVILPPLVFPDTTIRNGLSGTNALAYFASSSVTEKKVLCHRLQVCRDDNDEGGDINDINDNSTLRLPPGVNAINLLSPSLTLRQNKLERLSMKIIFNPV